MLLLEDQHEPPVEEECRICLQSHPVLMSDMCACRSSVHPDCLVQWRSQFARDHRKRHRCEVCLAEYTIPIDDEDSSSDEDDEEEEKDCIIQCAPCLMSLFVVGGVSYGLYVYTVHIHRLAPRPLFIFALASTIILPFAHEFVDSHRHSREFYYKRFVNAVLLLLGGLMVWITLNVDNVVAGLFEYIFAIYFVWFMGIVLRGCHRRR